jgi:hypothetical protein
MNIILGSDLKITEVVLILGLLFARLRSLIYFETYFVATFWANFFTNSSGRNAENANLKNNIEKN